MNQRAITLSVALFILIVIGMFAFTYLQRTDIVPTNNEDDQMNSEEPDTYASIDRIDAKHFYVDGVHTIAGELSMPTPCDLLETSSLVAESYPEQVTLTFDVINNADFCAQVIRRNAL